MPHSKGWRRDQRRRSSTEVPLGDVLDELLRERVFARGAPIGRLATRWAEVVGPRLAAETAPVSLEQGVLVVAATSGPWGAQARFLAAEIRRRANEVLGEELAARVQVVVRPDARKTL
jgi:predicted nucleic acid-binding Zn ribbon protein